MVLENLGLEGSLKNSDNSLRSIQRNESSIDVEVCYFYSTGRITS